METRYRALRLIVATYKAIAILVFILTILFIVLQLFTFTVGRGTFGYGSFIGITLLSVAGTFITGSILAISLYAFSNLIELFIDMEENTRLTAHMLRRIVAKSEKSTPIG